MPRLRVNGAASLDPVDRQLLRRLAASGRVSMADLGRAVRMSRPSVAERLRRLEDRGVVRRFTVDVDPKQLGFAFGAYIRVRPETGQLKKVTALLAEIPEIVECDRITGDDCFMAKAVVRSIADLEQVIDRLAPYASTNTSIIQSSPVPRRLPPLES